MQIAVLKVKRPSIFAFLLFGAFQKLNSFSTPPTEPCPYLCRMRVGIVLLK